MKQRLKSAGQKAWIKLQPSALKAWLQFEVAADKLFALSDHSAIRTPRIFLRVSIFILVIFSFGLPSLR